MIDDERAILDVVRSILELQGYEVLSADDGSRGFATAQRRSPDVIVLDLMMPVMDGFAVLEALRANERTAGVPVLVLTAIQSGDIEGRCAELGAASFVRKPFEPDELVRAVGALTGP